MKKTITSIFFAIVLVATTMTGATSETSKLTNEYSLETGGLPNDACTGAIDINCGETVTGDTAAGTDTGNNAAPDVWYSFTGQGLIQDITVSLCDGGTDYDSLLRVFDACGGTQIASNDDSCGVQSELTFTSDGTSTYFIMVEGFSNGSGLYSLAISCTPQDPGANDTCDTASPVACGDVIVDDTSIGSDTGGNAAPDLWYSFTGSGALENVTISLCDGGTAYDSLIRIFDVCGGTQIAGNDDACGLQSEVAFSSDGVTTYFIQIEGFGSDAGAFSMAVSCEVILPDNDECAGAIPVQCQDVVTGNTAQGTDSGGNTAADLWYSFTGQGVMQDVTASLCGSDFDTLIRIFDACDGTEIAVNDDSCGLQSEVTFTSDGTSTYFIMVEGFGSDDGAFTLEITCNPDDPETNDDCEFAIDVNCGDTVVGETLTASDSGGNAAADVWYSFTGQGQTQDITVSLCDGGTDYDSLLRVFDACDGTEIAVNDDSCGLQSEVTFTSDGTSTYFIMVEGFGDNSGNFSLAITCSPDDPGANDSCEDASAVACGDTVIGDTSIGSDTGGNAAPDLWYSFTGTGLVEDVTLSLCDGGTDYDSILRVFDACDGTEIAANDDFCGVQSELTFTSDGTSTYFIMVEGFGTGSGNFSLAITCETQRPDNDECDNAIAIACDDTVTGETNSATDSGGNAAGDVWYSFTGTGNEQNVTLSLCDGGTDYDSLLRVFDACGGTEIAVNDDACGVQSELTFLSDGTSTYFIMVEGFGAGSGNYSLAITCEDIAGINDNNFADFSYYPNPASDMINFNANQNVEHIALYNMLGQKVLEQSVNTVSGQINIQSLRTGNYIMQTTINGNTQSFKVIKK